MFWNLTIFLHCRASVLHMLSEHGLGGKWQISLASWSWHQITISSLVFAAGIWLDIYLIKKHCSFRVVNTCEMFIKRIKVLSSCFRNEYSSNLRTLFFLSLFSVNTVSVFRRNFVKVFVDVIAVVVALANEFSVIIITKQYHCYMQRGSSHSIIQCMPSAICCRSKYYHRVGKFEKRNFFTNHN